MPNTISNCNVTVNAGPTDAQVDLVQGLQEITLKQLDVLSSAHGSLKASTHVTGIHVHDVDDAEVVNSSVSGSDVGIDINTSKRVAVRAAYTEGAH